MHRTPGDAGYDRAVSGSVPVTGTTLRTWSSASCAWARNSACASARSAQGAWSVGSRMRRRASMDQAGMRNVGEWAARLAASGAASGAAGRTRASGEHQVGVELARQARHGLTGRALGQVDADDRLGPAGVGDEPFDVAEPPRRPRRIVGDRLAAPRRGLGLVGHGVDHVEAPAQVGRQRARVAESRRPRRRTSRWDPRCGARPRPGRRRADQQDGGRACRATAAATEPRPGRSPAAPRGAITTRSAVRQRPGARPTARSGRRR